MEIAYGKGSYMGAMGLRSTPELESHEDNKLEL